VVKKQVKGKYFHNLVSKDLQSVFFPGSKKPLFTHTQRKKSKIVLYILFLLRPPSPPPTPLHLWPTQQYHFSGPTQPTPLSTLFLVHTLPRHVLTARAVSVVFLSPPARTPRSARSSNRSRPRGHYLTTTTARSLSARSRLPTGAPIPVTPGGDHDWLSLLTLLALAAGSFPPRFL
jgi:hypothetical protein